LRIVREKIGREDDVRYQPVLFVKVPRIVRKKIKREDDVRYQPALFVKVPR
jgi:hypothetical protein